MKKYFSLMLLAIFALLIVSCNDDDDVVDNDTYPAVADITRSFTASDDFNNLYGIYETFSSPIPSTDVILVYRLDDSSGTAVWKLLPKTYYFNEGGELDYTFDFTSRDIQISAEANFNLTTTTTEFKNEYLNNQTFRVVFIPASGKTSRVNFENYNEVINYFNIDDSSVVKL